MSDPGGGAGRLETEMRLRLPAARDAAVPQGTARARHRCRGRFRRRAIFRTGAASRNNRRGTLQPEQRSPPKALRACRATIRVCPATCRTSGRRSLAISASRSSTPGRRHRRSRPIRSRKSRRPRSRASSLSRRITGNWRGWSRRPHQPQTHPPQLQAPRTLHRRITSSLFSMAPSTAAPSVPTTSSRRLVRMSCRRAR